MCFKGLKGLKKHKNFFKHNISIVIIEKRMNRAKDYNAFYENNPKTPNTSNLC